MLFPGWVSSAAMCGQIEKSTMPSALSPPAGGCHSTKS